MIRMMEYDFMIALANSKWHRNKKRLKLPRSCIIYLRAQDTSIKEDTLEIELQDGNVVRYKVPILMVRNYSIEEIFEKHLLILLPYYIIKYEKELPTIAGNEARLQALEQGTDKMCKLMQKVMESGDMEALSRIATDKAYRNELYKRFGI